MGKETTIISQPASQPASQPWAKCAFFRCQFGNYAVITQSRYSCVKWIYVCCKKAVFLLPAGQM